MPRSLGARIGIGAVVAGVITLGGAGVVLFGWAVDETHFDRPSAEFDALRTEIAAVEGVDVAHSERWVEAPTFSDPSSAVLLKVRADALPDLLALACASTYPDPVSWAVEVDTVARTRISLFSDAGRGCLDVGFDPLSAVAEIDRSAPGAQVQAAVMENGMFTLYSLDDAFEDLIPLVSRAETVRDAAGLPPAGAIEVAGSRLSVAVGPGEGPAFEQLLTRLIDDHDVTSFFSPAGGTPIDGVEKVQVTAPERHHAAVEAAIARSTLPIAGLPVTFLPQ
ncbi:hypothetical protein [Microbacterium proteolyticum]|uniref:hypothetical protein n=1 Tax=Microbacterium proteolyticum TaxID=1572644 RepID=UPI001FACE121|nr:hypothetical protein [Microbacterium proteolyticum]MCI9858713.1 hypothetical protein [Microbacterium proteolyticum]